MSEYEPISVWVLDVFGFCVIHRSITRFHRGVWSFMIQDTQRVETSRHDAGTRLHRYHWADVEPFIYALVAEPMPSSQAAVDAVIMPSIATARVQRRRLHGETSAEDGDMRTTRQCLSLRTPCGPPCRAFCCGPFCLGGQWSTSRCVGRRCYEDGNNKLSHAASSIFP